MVKGYGWLDHWLHDHPLVQLQDEVDQNPENKASVHDYWIEGRGWDWQHVTDSISHTNLVKLASTSLQWDTKEGDQLGWLKPNGVFFVQSAYEVHTNLKEEGVWLGWKRIWKLKVQQCVKTFIWTLSHDRILTNQCLWRRKLVDNPSCTRCNCKKEDAIYTLRDCLASNEVWTYSPQASTLRNFFSLPLREWLLKDLNPGRKGIE